MKYRSHFQAIIVAPKASKNAKQLAYKSSPLPANLQIILIPYISQKNNQKWAEQVIKVAQQAFLQAPQNNYDATATARASVAF